MNPNRHILITVAALSLGSETRYELVRYTTRGQCGTVWELVRTGETGIRKILAQTDDLPRKAVKEVEFRACTWGLAMGLAPRWTMTAEDLS